MQFGSLHWLKQNKIWGNLVISLSNTEFRCPSLFHWYFQVNIFILISYTLFLVAVWICIWKCVLKILKFQDSVLCIYQRSVSIRYQTISSNHVSYLAFLKFISWQKKAMVITCLSKWRKNRKHLKPSLFL